MPKTHLSFAFAIMASTAVENLDRALASASLNANQFMELPAEIRLNIYRQLSGSVDTYRLDNAVHLSIHNILATCKHIRCEALEFIGQHKTLGTSQEAIDIDPYVFHYEERTILKVPPVINVDKAYELLVYRTSLRYRGRMTFDELPSLRLVKHIFQETITLFRLPTSRADALWAHNRARCFTIVFQQYNEHLESSLTTKKFVDMLLQARELQEHLKAMNDLRLAATRSEHPMEMQLSLKLVHPVHKGQKPIEMVGSHRDLQTQC